MATVDQTSIRGLKVPHECVFVAGLPRTKHERRLLPAHRTFEDCLPFRPAPGRTGQKCRMPFNPHFRFEP